MKKKQKRQAELLEKRILEIEGLEKGPDGGEDEEEDETETPESTPSVPNSQTLNDIAAEDTLGEMMSDFLYKMYISFIECFLKKRLYLLLVTVISGIFQNPRSSSLSILFPTYLRFKKTRFKLLSSSIICHVCVSAGECFNSEDENFSADPISTPDCVSDGWTQLRGAVNGHSKGPEEEQPLDGHEQMKDDTPANPYDSGTEGSEPTNPYPACNSAEEKEPRPPCPATTDGNGPLICGMVESQCPRVQDSEGPGSVEGPRAEMGLSMEVDPSAQVTPEEESLKDGQCGALTGEQPLPLMLCVLLTNLHPPLLLSRCVCPDVRFLSVSKLAN